MKVGLIAGLATIPTTILLYYVLGLTVDAAWQGSNLIRQWFWVLCGLVLLKAALAWLFRTGQFRASSEAKLNVRDQIYQQVVRLGPGLLGKRRTGEIANTATEGVEYLDYYFSVYFVQIWVAIAIPDLPLLGDFLDRLGGRSVDAGRRAADAAVCRFFRARLPPHQRAERRGQESQQRPVPRFHPGHEHAEDVQPGSPPRQADGGRQRGAAPHHDEAAAGRPVAVRVPRAGLCLFSTAVAMGVALYRYTGGFMTPGEVVAVVLLSLEFSRTLLLIGEFFFAGALGREVAAKVVEFLNEKAPVSSDEGAHVCTAHRQGDPYRVA